MENGLIFIDICAIILSINSKGINKNEKNTTKK